MTFPRDGETLLDAIEREAAEAERDAIVDVFLHPVLTDPRTQPSAEIPRLAELGHTSLTFFTSFGGFTSTPEPYLDAVRITAEQGMLTLVHCEDAAMLEFSLRRLVQLRQTGVEHYARSLPPAAESTATNRVIAMAELTGAPLYIHLSCKGALTEVRNARSRGLSVWIETRPLYLHLTEEHYRETKGTKYVGQPPLRSPSDREALWHAVASDEIDTVCTDHAAWMLVDKVTPGMDVTSVRAGVPDLDTSLTMLFSEGVVSGRISPPRFVDRSSTNAAKLFGLFARKGTIAPGSDADVTIWNPELTKPVRAQETATRSVYSPFEGWSVTGWPELTISRGEVIFETGNVAGIAGRGKLLRRGPTRSL